MGAEQNNEFKELVFDIIPKQETFSLENQEGCTYKVNEDVLKDYLEDMINYPDEFIILTAPEAQNKIRYVQARMLDDEELNVTVQIGWEENGTRLYEKICSIDESIQIFFDYYHNSFVPNMKEYEPVKFRV